MTEYTNYVSFLFELGMLKRVQREGWKLLGISNPESIAEHSLRAAQIGYILAVCEQYESPEKICSMLVFHDIGECRIGDIHKVANRYIDTNERHVVKEQTQDLGTIGEKIFALWDTIEQQNTVGGIIAKDADLLEMVVTACELRHMNILGLENWLQNTEKRLQTHTAKTFFSEITHSDPISWWKGLKKLSIQ